MAAKKPKADAITAEAMDALLEFLPIFEKKGFAFGNWSGGECDEDGCMTMPMFEPSADVRRFLKAVEKHGWIVPFDWAKWQGQAARYFKSPDRLKKASIETLRKLLTLHVRKERFCEGHLAAIYESGHLVAILRRLRAIHAGVK